MLPKILTQIFGSRNDRLLKTYRRVVEQHQRAGAATSSASTTRRCAPRPMSSGSA